ncbi:MAG: glycosyl hydrolase family 8 [Candidatus Magasanikbacteria bacterium]
MVKEQIAQSNWLKEHWILLAILLASAFVHMTNMFGFPSYREDEGTYMSQAWAVINQHELASYTYWYDHAPLGWIFIALWNFFTGNDFFMGGLTANTGRLFVAILQIFSTYFVYNITWNITRRKFPSAIAAILFSITPLSVMLHRRVLLDNIMMFWFLWSLYLLTKPMRLKYIIASAIMFAMAVLTKESAAPFIVGMSAIIALQAHKNNKHFAIVVWISIASLAISMYPVFALLKGEFFPSGTVLGGTQPHVSLMEALGFHINRQSTSTFLYSLQTTWLPYAPFFLFLGAGASIIHVLLFRKKWSFLIALMSLSYTLFILRGQVLDWYIIPLMALFSISIALLSDQVIERVKKKDPVALMPIRFGILSIISLILVFELSQKWYIFSLDQTYNQVQAVGWVKDNLNPRSVTLIDNYPFVDLNPNLKDIEKTNIHYYWKADTDPQVQYAVLNNDWKRIDYLLFTPALTINIYNDTLPLVQTAYENSHVIKRFNNYDILDEGYPVEIREVNNKDGVIQKSWEVYKKEFITRDGKTIDPKADNITTSEGQSYSLLRAVWQGDKKTFDRVFSWSEDNMKLPGNKLYAWLYGKNTTGTEAILDYSTATDADEDIALALLFAYKQWGDPIYMERAREILDSIWENRVIEVDGTLYLTSGADTKTGYLINPSYFSPASYKIFAQIDKNHNWDALAEDVYVILAQLKQSPTFKNNTGLVPNWFLLTSLGDYESAEHVKKDADIYGYDAFRLMWRLALDAKWFESTEAKAYLEQVSKFYIKQWDRDHVIEARYKIDGTPVANFDDISTYAGALSALDISQSEKSIDIYSDHFWSMFHNGKWGDDKNYYTQNWAWFATALYANNTPNLWQTQLTKN